MKGQISVELIIILFAVMVIFSFLLSSIGSQQSEFVSSRNTLHAKEVAEKVASSMNGVFLAGYNTSKNISLPTTLRGNTTYMLSVNDTAQLLYIAYNDKTYNVPLLTSNITGNFLNHFRINSSVHAPTISSYAVT